MKTDAEINRLLRNRQYANAQYAAIERIKKNRIDTQAWAFLGQALIDLRRGKMAELCVRRVALLDPFASWVHGALRNAQAVHRGNDDPVILKLLDHPHPTVSACVLTRDNARTIRHCLESLLPAVDEIVVVDTGSKDDTVSIIESLGIHVHYFEWRDDFAVARNYAQSLATGEWIIAIDSDENLLPEDQSAIRTIAGIHSLTQTPSAIRIAQISKLGNGSQITNFMGRMCKRNAGIYWQRRIHESLHHPDGLPAANAPIRVMHDGYFDAQIHLQKIERNIRILGLAVDDDPNDPDNHYYLGRELFQQKSYAKAEASLRKAIALNENESIDRPLFNSELISLLIETGRINDAESEAEKQRRLYPHYPDGFGWLAYTKNSEELAKEYAKVSRSYRGLSPVHFGLAEKIRVLLHNAGNK